MEKQIMVVDDEALVAESIALKIGRLKHPFSYHVDICSSARQAVRMWEEKNYSLIITDMKMPFVTGVQLVKMLRDRKFPGIILVLSGYDDFEYVREAFINGANDYLLKPISVRDLDQKIRMFLEKDRQDGEARPEPEDIPCNDVVAYAVRYIRNNYKNSNLTMKDVARHVAVSYSYFSNLFRREMGETFPSYLRGMRVQKAIELLEDPMLKISDICYQVGFKYPQQFSNDFKKVTGVYPSQYFGKARGPHEDKHA